jgi:hypothetical protein
MMSFRSIFRPRRRKLFKLKPIMPGPLFKVSLPPGVSKISKVRHDRPGTLAGKIYSLFDKMSLLLSGGNQQ